MGFERTFEHADCPPTGRISVVLAVAQWCAILWCIVERVAGVPYPVERCCACDVPLDNGPEDVEVGVGVFDEPTHEASPEAVFGDVWVSL